MGKGSLVVIAGLSAVCLGLLWNQQKTKSPTETKDVAIENSAALSAAGNRGTISVSSMDVRSFAADEFEVRFQIRGVDNDKNKAFVLMTEGREKVLALLKALNIDEKSFEISGAAVGENWSYNSKNVRENAGYLAEQSFRVRRSSRDSAEILTQKLTPFAFVDGLEIFARLKDAKSLEAAFVKEACEKAKQKAQEYAQSVGVKAGLPLAVMGQLEVSEYGRSDSVTIYGGIDGRFQIDGKNGPQKSYIFVNQKESKKFLGDRFAVSASIQVYGDRKDELHKAVKESHDQVLELAKNFGAQDEDVESKSMFIRNTESWAMDADKKGKNLASQNVTVNFKSKDQADAFYSAVAGVKNVLPQSANTILSKRDSLQTLVTDLAGKNALSLAQSLADGFGGRMGDVVIVQDKEFTTVDDFYEHLDIRSMRTNYMMDAPGRSNMADSVEIRSAVSIKVEMKF